MFYMDPKTRSAVMALLARKYSAEHVSIVAHALYGASVPPEGSELAIFLKANPSDTTQDPPPPPDTQGDD
jgi:hypothetical protein